MNSKSRILFLAALWLCGFCQAQSFRFLPDRYSQITSSKEIAESGFTYNMPLTVNEGNWSEITTTPSVLNTRYKFKSVQDIVRVGINHDSAVIATPYKYRVYLSVHCIDHISYSSPAPLTLVKNITLDITYHPDSLQTYQDLSVYKFSGYHGFQVKITGVSDISSGTPVAVPAASLQRNFFVESEVSVQRYDLTDCNNTIVVGNNLSADSRELEVKWALLSGGAVPCRLSGSEVSATCKPAIYELEWTYIDDYRYNLATGTASYAFATPGNIAYDFRKNSTRVQVTTGRSFRIPLIYEHGALIYRVREVRPDKTNYKDLVYGAWTLPETGVTDASSFCFPGSGYLISNPHMHDSLNWQYTINFAEEGKYKHVINYFDGSLKDRQTQTRINTDANHIVSVGKVYDYEGRPSLVSLPVPLRGQSTLNYRSDLMLNAATGQPYKAADFDGPDCGRPDSIAPLANTSAAHIYYSPLNGDNANMQAYVPDAQGYPMVQTIYSPDNTNKVSWQGGAGWQMQLWRGHGTQYEYVRPVQPELDRLLGTEAGKYAHYPRQIVTDPNGQSSFSIIDPAGKVVISGLQGDAPDTSKIPIDTLSNFVRGKLECYDLLNGLEQDKGSNSLAAATMTYQDHDGNATFKYSIQTFPFPACLNKYLNAKAQYEMEVTSDCGAWITGTSGAVGSFGATTSSAAAYAVTIPELSVIGMPKGKYLVNKRVYFSKYDIRHLVDSFVFANEPVCYSDVHSFIRTAVDSTVFPCAGLIDSSDSYCDHIKKQMMLDLAPGAKYGRYTKNEDSLFEGGADNSIFTRIQRPKNLYALIPYGVYITRTGFDGAVKMPVSTSSIDPVWRYSLDDINYVNLYVQRDLTAINELWLQWGQTIRPVSDAFVPGRVYYRAYVNIDKSTPLDTVLGQFILDDILDSVVINGVVTTQPDNYFAAPFVVKGFQHGMNEIRLYGRNEPYQTEVSGYFMGVKMHTYRYQDTCIHLPDSVVKDGVVYKDLRNQPPQTLIDIFNDDIAEALLPLHPEYCKLAYCNDADFEQLLESTTDFRQAMAHNMFSLDSLVAHDPLVIKGPAGTADKLKIFQALPGTRLDRMAIEYAYCGAGNAEQKLFCATNQYAAQIAAMTFINDTVKQAYYEILHSAYIGNRNVLKQRMLDKAGSTCSTCTSLRMTRDGAPASPPVDSVLISGISNKYADFPQWMKVLFRGAEAGDPSGMSSVPEPLPDSLASVNRTIYNARAGELVKQLANCTMNQVLLDRIRKAALNVQISGRELTPELVRSIITDTAGLSINDLCHPFLVSYNSPGRNDAEKLSYSCGDQSLYEGLKNLLQRTETINEIMNAPDKASGAAAVASASFVLDPANLFEQQFGTSATVRAYTEGVSPYCSDCYIGIEIAGTAKTDVIHILARNFRTGTNIKTLLNTAGPARSFTKAYCLNEDPEALSNGYMARRTAVVENSCSSCTPQRYYVWTDATDLMTPALSGANLKQAVTCIDVRNMLDSFNTRQPDHGYSSAVNHPLAAVTIANYLNYKLGKQYGWNEYSDLMEGCAVTDRVALKKQIAGYRIEFSSDAYANAFINIINTFGRLRPDLLRYKPASGNPVLLVDLNSVSLDSLLAYKLLLDGTLPGFSYSGVSARAYNYSPAADNTSFLFAVSSCTFSPASYATIYSSDTLSVWENDGYTSGYKLYQLRQNTGATARQEADMIAGMENYLHGSALATYPSCNSNYLLSGREMLRSSDYSSTLKQEYLDYIYGLSPGLSRAAVLAAIDPAGLGSYLSSYAGKSFTYDDPYCTGSRKHLYAYNAAPGSGVSEGYDLLKGTILSGAGSTLFPNADFTSKSAGLKVIRKANGDYWYRYFDGINHLYNVYITPPSATLGIAWSAYSFSLSSTRMGPDPKTFTVDVTSGGNTVRCRGYADFTLSSGSVMAGNIMLDKDAGGVYCADSLDCEHDLLATAVLNGRAAYQRYFDSTTERVSNDMMAHLLQTTKDSIVYCGQRQQYQQTLYYYDLVGNLTRTVPPAGIVAVADGALATVVNNRNGAGPDVKMTSHKKVSVYTYNSLDQLTYQKTPDGGTTYFFYDAAGRQIFSQNSRQRPEGKYSYSLYDRQGRPMETGQVAMGCTYPTSTAEFDTTYCYFYPRNGSSGTMISSAHPDFVQYSYDENAYPYDTLVKYVRSKTREEVVVTTYDTMRMDLGVISTEMLSTQENLRSRVSAISYYLSMPPATAGLPANPTFASYYSYDLNGNVQTLTYDYYQLNPYKQRFKRVDYDYDLVSGKVNMVSYNRGRPDQFYQQYDYDADNRITLVQTSSDGLIWNKDARYSYYKHGPLASLKLGDIKLQSLEYAYTIQGWLKAMNGDELSPDKDMGRNGGSGDRTYARDVVAHALQYFKDDYKAITSNRVTNQPEPAKNLYNGNIAQQSTGIAGLGMMQRSYRYDQLQRLKLATNTVPGWVGGGGDAGGVTLDASPANLYKSSYSYDRDGNITALQRYDGAVTPALMDNFTYKYSGTAGAATDNNKLLQVSDAVTTTTGGNDLQHGQVTDNYSYDRTGNLIRDKQGAELIDWDHFGKVRSIRDTASNRFIAFGYDGKGNRIWKEVSKPTGAADNREGEYYVRDAGGNILSVYRTHSLYDRALKFTTITGSVIGTTPLASTLASLVDRSFPSGVMGVITTAHSGWVTTYTNRPLSFYMGADPTLKSSLLYSGDAWIDALRSADVSTGATTLRDAFINAGMNVTTMFNAAMTLNTEGHKLFELFSQSMPQASASPVWSAVGSQYIPGNHVANANNLYNATTGNAANQQLTAQNMASALSVSFTSSPPPPAAFYDDVISGNTLWQSSTLRGANGVWTSEIRNIMNVYGDVAKLTTFFDGWSGGSAALAACTTPGYRLKTVYESAPVVTLGDMVTQLSTPELSSVLTAMTDLTVTEFAMKLARYGTDEHSVNSMLSEQVSDTFALSEHHIYGSSRLGVQRYDSTVLANMRHETDTLNRLNGLKRWYSHSFGDLIDSTKKEPYGTEGNMDISTFKESPTEYVSRTLGRRYYELTDHLGNVLATVLDRKTGKGSRTAGGVTMYDRWHADIASATDYYPGGMMMPGRNKEYSWSRMGNQGQEMDDEIYGKGNVYAFKYRLEDARINRFFSVDPLARKYSHLSSYQFGDNAYIGATELEGAEANWLWNASGYRPDTNPEEFIEDMGVALKDPNTHMRAAMFVGQLLPWIGFAALTEGAGSMIMGEMAIAGEARLMRGPLRMPTVESPALAVPTAELSVSTSTTTAVEATSTTQAASRHVQTGRTLLYSFEDNYAEIAQSENARYFQVPEQYYSTEANNKFIDRAISRGDNIVLSRPIQNINPRSVMAKEVKRVMDSGGYIPSSDQRTLIPFRSNATQTSTPITQTVTP